MNLKSWSKLVPKRANPSNPYGVRASMQKPSLGSARASTYVRDMAEKARKDSTERQTLNKLPVGRHVLDEIIIGLTKRKKFKTVTELRRVIKDIADKRGLRVKQIEVDCRTTKICPSLDNRGRKIVKSKPAAKLNATEWREKLIRENPDIPSHPLYRKWLSFGNTWLIEHAQNIARVGANGEVEKVKEFMLLINPPTQEEEIKKRFDLAIEKVSKKV